MKNYIAFFAFLLFSYFPGNILSQTIKLTASPQYVRIGDLDIPGNQITVEALVKFTGGVNIVSKHTGPANVNYLMRIGTFEITTSTQFYLMSNPYASSMQPDTWYHVAGTYDGSFIRYYVNGCLIVQQAATGNIVQNNLITGIGNISSAPNGEQFFGEIDELRIWNIARTPAQLTANMFDLPNPTTYTNLKAYYKFDGNVVNIQGNATFNGVWVGTPAYGTQPLPNVIPSFSVQSVPSTNVSCFGASDGTITVNATGNNLLYSINNTTWQTQNVFSGLAPGNYTVYTRTPEGCTITESNVVITQPAQVTSAAGNTGPYCASQSIQLNGSSSTPGVLSYNWSGPGGYTSTVQNPSDATSAGTYTLIVTSNGCTSTATTIVTIKPTPDAQASNTGPYCSGQAIQLNGTTTSTGPNTYSWIGPGGYTSAAQNPSNATQTGTYQLTVTSDGCTSIPASTIVSLTTTPIATATNSGPYCQGQAIQLTGSTTSTGTSTFSWTGPGGFTSAVQNPSNATAAGTYTLTVNSGGCISAPVNTLVVLKPVPDALASNTGPYCQGQATQLNGATTSTGVNTFTWTGPGGFASTLQNPSTATMAGTYVFTVTSDGCSSTPASTSLVITPTPLANASNTGPYCQGQPLQLNGSTTSPGTNTYAWTGPGGFTSTSQNPSNITLPGTYELIVTSNGCISTPASTVIVIHPLPDVTANNTGPYYYGQTAQLQAASTTAGTVTYAWSGPGGYSSNAQNPANVINAGIYTVTLTDANGCKATASTLVAFSSTAYVTVPNVFTPNGDGSNDVFFIRNEGMELLKCAIFNRWGVKIYEINSPQGSWDGKTPSGEVTDGTYFYVLDARDFSGKAFSEKGSIFIAR